MSGKRKLSIGITVNLENYENLKVEVEGEAEGEKDAGDLIEYLDTVLSRLGRNDPETKKKIDCYRRRVLENPGDHTGETDAPSGEQVPVMQHSQQSPSMPEEPEKKRDDEKIPESAVRSKPEPEEKPAEVTGFSCSACGRPISKAEEQLSQIFMGRSLCKKCLEDMQK